MASNLSTSALESEVYWSLKNEVLIELRERLVDRLQIEKTFSYLRSIRVFDRVDCDEIEAEKTPNKKREKFLDVLGDKGPTALDHLCHAIQKRCTGQGYLLDEILTTFDRKKQERKDPDLDFVVPGTASDIRQVDLNNLPVPGDPGAPIPPDEIDPATGHGPGQSTITTPNSSPLSHISEPPPPYSE